MFKGSGTHWNSPLECWFTVMAKGEPHKQTKRKRKLLGLPLFAYVPWKQNGDRLSLKPTRGIKQHSLMEVCSGLLLQAKVTNPAKQKTSPAVQWPTPETFSRPETTPSPKKPNAPAPPAHARCAPRSPKPPAPAQPPAVPNPPKSGRLGRRRLRFVGSRQEIHFRGSLCLRHAGG